MQSNLKKHKLLVALQKKSQANKEAREANVVGITYKKMQQLLKINQNELEILLSELLHNKEVNSYNMNNEKGCFINKELGYLAISKRTYLKRNEDLILNRIKLFTYLSIIVLVALYVVSLVLKISYYNL